MELRKFSECVHGVFEDYPKDFRPEDKWFAWFAAKVAYYLRPSGKVEKWEYENIADAMQEAAQGHRAQKEVPEIEVL